MAEPLKAGVEFDRVIQPNEAGVQCQNNDPNAPNLSSTPGADINIRKAQIIVGGIAYVAEQVANQTLVAQIATVVNIGAGAYGLWKAVAAGWPALVRILEGGPDAWDVWKPVAARITQFRQDQAAAAAAANLAAQAQKSFTLEQAIADGLVKPVGGLYQVLNAIQNEFLSAQPKSALDALGALDRALGTVGFEVKVSLTADGGFSLLAGSGIAGEILPSGAIILTKNGITVLRLVP